MIAGFPVWLVITAGCAVLWILFVAAVAWLVPGGAHRRDDDAYDRDTEYLFKRMRAEQVHHDEYSPAGAGQQPAPAGVQPGAGMVARENRAPALASQPHETPAPDPPGPGHEPEADGPGIPPAAAVPAFAGPGALPQVWHEPRPVADFLGAFHDAMDALRAMPLDALRAMPTDEYVAQLDAETAYRDSRSLHDSLRTDVLLKLTPERLDELDRVYGRAEVT